MGCTGGDMTGVVTFLARVRTGAGGGGGAALAGKDRRERGWMDGWMDWGGWGEPAGIWLALSLFS